MTDIKTYTTAIETADLCWAATYGSSHIEHQLHLPCDRLNHLVCGLSLQPIHLETASCNSTLTLTALTRIGTHKNGMSFQRGWRGPRLEAGGTQ